MGNRVKMGFSELNVPDKIQKAHVVHDAMLANFPEAGEQLAELDAANHALELAYQDALDGGKAKKAIMYQQEQALIAVVVGLAAHVESVCKGDALKIRSSGFDVRNTATAATLPEQPQALRAVTSQYNGEVLLSWKPVNNAKSYSIEQSSDGTTDWKICGTSTRSRTAIDGLTSMTNVYFRVMAIGSAGESPVSAAAKALVA